MITPSDAQAAVIRAIVEWYRSPIGPREFYLAGYAGTGKTTIAQVIASRFNGQVVFAAYTGKAAAVLREKGCGNAQTIHGLIYRPREVARTAKRTKADGTEEEFTVRELAFDLHGAGLADPRMRQLVIIDECSMVGAKIGTDLLGFRKPVLVLGDPAQLPPVGDGGFFTSGEPDAMLTEIHRQKEGCGILDIATAVRTGVPLRCRSYEESMVLPRTSMWTVDPLEFDQVIVGTNKTRRAMNRRIRMRLGREGKYPVEGDRLICLRNNHRIGLMNGEQVEVVKVERFVRDLNMLEMIVEKDGAAISVKAPLHYFDEEPGEAPWSGDNYTFFDFGYAITCHKSQGSQWPRVLVINESSVFRSDAARWLYTAVTRASKQVVVVG